MSGSSDILKYAGSMQQAAYIRPVVFAEGRSRGMSAYDVKCGALSYQVLADKCLDVSALSYKGMNLTFLSKPGLQGRAHYDTNGAEAQRSIMGGLFFTAGLENICAPCTIEGTDYPMHGRIRTTPAEHLCADASWEDGKYVLRISGEMREAMLFGENLVLRRSLTSVYGEKSILLEDEFINESCSEEALMVLYHINLGWPFLDEDLRLYLPTRKVTARDSDARGHEERYDRMDAPKDGEPEYVFIHDLKADPEGNTMAVAVNEKYGIGLALSWNVSNLPYFMEWKSTASGDYVIGLEPANASVFGRTWHHERDCVPKIGPFEKQRRQIRFTVLDGAEEISAALAEYEKIAALS